MAKKLVVNYKGHLLEVWVGNAGVAGMAEVGVWEVMRPQWLIFRCRYVGSRTFFVEDYDTIAQGTFQAIKSLFDKEEREEKLSKKWKEFEKNY